MIGFFLWRVLLTRSVDEFTESIPSVLAQGNYNELGPLYERAIAILEAALGSDHPHVAVGLNNLAGLLCKQVSHEFVPRNVL